MDDRFVGRCSTCDFSEYVVATSHILAVGEETGAEWYTAHVGGENHSECPYCRADGEEERQKLPQTPLLKCVARRIRASLAEATGDEPACPACLDAGREGVPREQIEFGRPCEDGPYPENVSWIRVVDALPECGVPDEPAALCWGCRQILASVELPPVSCHPE